MVMTKNVTELPLAYHVPLRGNMMSEKWAFREHDELIFSEFQIL